MLLRLFSVVLIIEISKKENDEGVHCIGVFLPPTLVLKIYLLLRPPVGPKVKGEEAERSVSSFFRKDAFWL